MVWFTSQLHGPSVRFGVYKNAFVNRDQCDDITEHLKSMQFYVPPPPPKKKKAKRLSKAQVHTVIGQQGDQDKERQLQIHDLYPHPSRKGPESPLVGLASLTKLDDESAFVALPQNVPLTANVPRYWTLILLGGGHFAGMVVDLAGQTSKAHAQGTHTRDIKVMAHKAFHRYTVRKKQGGAQSSHGGANSAGARVRMYNERALKLEVRELLESWSDWVKQSECVFVHAPGNNRRTLYYDNSIISWADRYGRVRSIPFVTRRPTQTELKRAYVELTTVRVVTQADA